MILHASSTPPSTRARAHIHTHPHTHLAFLQSSFRFPLPLASFLCVPSVHRPLPSSCQHSHSHSPIYTPALCSSSLAPTSLISFILSLSSSNSLIQSSPSPIPPNDQTTASCQLPPSTFHFLHLSHMCSYVSNSPLPYNLHNFFIHLLPMLPLISHSEPCYS